MADTWSRRKSRRTARRKSIVAASRALGFLALGLSFALISLYLLFPVENVRVEGNEMLPDSAIVEDVPERASLPMISARDLESEVKSNPWVKGVSVNKSWDSGMVVVEVEERDAALNASLAGDKRVVLAEDGTRLPGLGGASLRKIELNEARLREIRAVQKVLERNGIQVESVESVGAPGVELSLRGPEESRVLALVSGEIGGGQARVLRGLLRDRDEARYFDLRTPGRVVVGTAPAQASRAPNGG